jgi:hypothetical protein
MGIYIHDKYLKKILDEIYEENDFNEDEKTLKDILEKAKRFMIDAEKKRERLKKEFDKKAKKYIYENVKRRKVTFEKFIKDGMYECMKDHKIDIYHPVEDEDEEKEIRELYNKLIEEDSDDVCVWTTCDVFKEYDNNCEFYSLDLLEWEINDTLEDGSDYWDNAEFTRIMDINYHIMGKHDQLEGDDVYEIAKQELYDEEKKKK